MSLKGIRPRHRAPKVIHEDGSVPLPERSGRFAGLRYAFSLAPGQVPAREGGWLAQAEHRLSAALTSATRTLPVVGQAEPIELRIPSSPDAPTVPIAPSAWVRFGFARAARELNELVKVLSSGWRKLAAENDARFRTLDERLDAREARQHAWLAEGHGRDLAAAYAEGGTEQLQKLTPEVLAAMDALSKSGSHLVATAGSAVSA